MRLFAGFYISLEICLSSVVSSISAAGVEFLGRQYDDNNWNQIKRTSHCQSLNGNWTSKRLPHTNRFALFPDVQAPCNQKWTHLGICDKIYEVGNSSSSLPSSLYYTWEVNLAMCGERADLKPLDVPKFCSIIRRGDDKGGRKAKSVMFIGDSITAQFYAEFLNAAYRELSSWPCNITILETTTVNIPCSHDDPTDFITATWVRNDYLSLDSKPISDLVVNYILHPWTQLLNENTSMLILNRGAHFVDHSRVLHELNKTLRFVRNNFPEISIVWRNTYPGIPDPRKTFAFEPLSFPEPVIDLWNWTSIHKQNLLVLELLKEHFPEVLTLNIHDSQTLRHDSRIDFIHQCVPGPMGNWLTLLYNMLLQL